MARLRGILTLAVCSSALLSGEQPAGTINQFVLVEIGGRPVQVQPSANRATVMVFVSALCPISLAYGERLTKLQRDFSNQGVRLLLVNSNQNEPDSQVEEQRKLSNLTLLVNRDPRGQLAEMLGVFSTPTAVVVDQKGMIRYLGAIDDSRNPARVTKQYLRVAIEAILEGKTVPQTRTTALGCSIKRSFP
jgi:alkyl hydroperoxide reductase subunit AhpC